MRELIGGCTAEEVGGGGRKVTKCRGQHNGVQPVAAVETDTVISKVGVGRVGVVMLSSKTHPPHQHTAQQPIFNAYISTYCNFYPLNTPHISFCGFKLVNTKHNYYYGHVYEELLVFGIDDM